MEKIIIGSHVSFNKDKQLFGSVLDAINYNASTFMFYTGAPQNTSRLPINEELTRKGQQLMKDNDIDINDVVIHAPYIINLANKQNQQFSVDFLKEEINRSLQLGIKKIVLHPGSHVGAGVEAGINNIAESLNMVFEDNQDIIVCLETMAGKGSEVGSKLEELKQIMDKVIHKEKLMICIDTCHLSDAGYDINNFDNFLNQFDKQIGISKIGCIHINDSKNPSSSHKDRHENIGLGSIGFNALINIVYNDKLKNVPKILETPFIDDEGSKYPPYYQEIEMIRSKKFNVNLINDILEYYR